MQSKNSKTKEVLVCDTAQDWIDTLAQILETMGISADFIGPDMPACMKKVEETSYAIFVVNVQSLKKPKEFLREFHSRHPELSILVTGDRGATRLADYLWPPDIIAEYSFPNRTGRGAPDLGALIKRVLDFKSRMPDISVRFDPVVDTVLSLNSQSRSNPSQKRQDTSLIEIKNELRHILGKLFAGDTNSESIAREITVEPFEGAGKSSSVLLQITPTILLDKEKKMSAILKFGPRTDILQEASRYDKYVQWFLTVDQTVRKIGFAETQSYAAILYSFPRDKPDGIVSFSEYMRENDTDSILDIIRKMFNVDNQNWLSVDGNKLVDVEETFFQHYYLEKVIQSDIDEMRENHLGILKSQINKLEKSLKEDIVEFAGENVVIKPLSLSIPNPVTFLERPLAEQVKMTVIHGDLHAENILIDDDSGRYFFIDFFYTGIGDIYRDFIELEISTRYDLFSSRRLSDAKRLTAKDSQTTNMEGLKKLLRLEKSLIDVTIRDKDLKDPLILDDPDLCKAHKIISEIRKHAFMNYPDKKYLYCLGLSYSLLRGLKYFYPLDVKLYRLFTSGLYVRLCTDGTLG
ncbi:MAG: hypothetical protein CEE38_11395 [Planctomycetes bacterium B3_Pla]|nr:MAG: hypothetical protein CEE38_11395 [Planctomycetes bacterium B3_Pla]